MVPTESVPAARSEYERDVVKHIAGTVGRDPEVKTSAKGEYVTFSLAVSYLYPSGDAEGQTRWYSVLVGKASLQDFVKSQVRKGTRLVCEGFETIKDGGSGRTFCDFNARRVGLVDWAATSGEKVPGGQRPTAPQAPTPIPDDDLGF